MFMMFYRYLWPRYQVSVYRTIGYLVLICAQNIDFGYMLEPPQLGSSNEYTQSMLQSKNKKIMYTPVHPHFSYIIVCVCVCVWGGGGDMLAWWYLRIGVFSRRIAVIFYNTYICLWYKIFFTGLKFRSGSNHKPLRPVFCITHTSQCNILHYFTAVKMVIFRWNVIFFLCWLKT